MRDPFKNRTIEDLAMQYALLEGPDAPTKMYSAYDVHKEICRRVGIYVAAEHIENARNILKMVSATDGPA